MTRLLLPLLVVGCAEPGTTPATPTTPAPTTPTTPTSPIDTGTAPATDPTTTVTTTFDAEPLPLELCVNEFMPANAAAVVDEYDGHADWIELHNPGEVAIPLDGWSLTDDPADPENHVLDGGLVLEPGAFLVLWADGFPELGPTHLGFSLAEEGEAVGLFAPDGSGSVLTYPEVPSDLAVARAADCCEEEGCIGYVFAGTPGRSNEP